MNIKVIFEGFSLSVKIKRIDEDNIEVVCPAFVKGQIPWSKFKIGDEIAFNIGTIMKGLGGMLEKFK